MRQVEKIGYLAARDDRRARAPLQRSGDKVMSIVTLTADGEKQVARRERAGIDGISRRLPTSESPSRDLSSAPIH